MRLQLTISFSNGRKTRRHCTSIQQRSRAKKKIYTSADTPGTVNVSFIGAGSYAQGNLLPNLPDKVGRVSVMTNSGTTSKRVAEKFGFQQAVATESDVFQGPTNTVFIATRHDSHGDLVEKALERIMHVFVETSAQACSS